MPDGPRNAPPPALPRTSRTHRRGTSMTVQFTAAEAYRRMAFIRAFEEQVLQLSREGEVIGSVHLCLGQEAVPVGAMEALGEQDRVLSTYRGHGWALACGVDP